MKVKSVKIIDNKGESFLVKKDSTEVKRPRFKNVVEKEPVKDEDKRDFTEKEIESLKELAKKCKDLLALLEEAPEESEEDEEESEEESEEKEEEIIDLSEDEDVEIEEKEEDDEIIDDEYCDESCQKKTHDSKKSFGSIERRKTTEVEDSVDDEVAQSWAKRYGGK